MHMAVSKRNGQAQGEGVIDQVGRLKEEDGEKVLDPQS